MKVEHPLPSREEWLLVDLGNSHTKFALATRDSLLEKRSISTASLSSKTKLEELLHGWTPTQVVIASVVPSATQILTDFCREAALPFFLVTHQGILEIPMSYPKSTSLGADCFANIVAAKKYYPFPSIVIDFGTAITFDVLDTEGVYLGVIIAPGLLTAAEALHEKTALLPQIIPTLPSQHLIGRNTIEAMHSGLMLGTRGLIREVITQVTQKYFSGKRPTIIATGGDAAFFKEDPSLFDVINPDLTLEGIREIACQSIESPEMATCLRCSFES